MPQHRGWLAALACVALVGTAVTARADLSADCIQSADLDRQIRACTILIEERRITAGDTSAAHINRANAYGLQGRHRHALDDYAAAIAGNPQLPLAFYNRARVHFDLGNTADAIADYTRAIGLEPDFALAYFNRGLVRELHGDHAGAMQDYSRVLVLEPTASKARARLHRLQAGMR